MKIQLKFRFFKIYIYTCRFTNSWTFGKSVSDLLIRYFLPFSAIAENHWPYLTLCLCVFYIIIFLSIYYLLSHVLLCTICFRMGYESKFTRRTGADFNEGSATFVKSSRFKLLDSHDLILHDAATKVLIYFYHII